jgi:HEPN domain-containing protein
MSEELELARQWMTKAANDLLNADNNLNAETIPLDTVCFHCQQAAEKLLKAFLVGKGRTYPITHDLLAILENILPTNSEAERLRDDLALLTPYAVEVRYPDDFYMPSLLDAREAREAADRVKQWLETAAPEIFSPAK